VRAPLVLAAFALLAALLVPGAGSAKTVGCGPIQAHGARYTVRIERGLPGCEVARTTLKTFIATARAPRRWVCFRGHGAQRWAAACSRGSAIVRAYPRA
jgi:hypothetical protein